TGIDTCNGGSCLHTGNPCPGADGDANCEESCDEAGDNCGGADPNGSSCDDDSVCTTSDHCNGGACVGGPLNCNDNSPCTNDTCDPVNGCGHNAAPATGCKTAGKSMLVLKQKSGGLGDNLRFRWSKGETLTQEELA